MWGCAARPCGWPVGFGPRRSLNVLAEPGLISPGSQPLELEGSTRMRFRCASSRRGTSRLLGARSGGPRVPERGHASGADRCRSWLGSIRPGRGARVTIPTGALPRSSARSGARGSLSPIWGWSRNGQAVALRRSRDAALREASFDRSRARRSPGSRAHPVRSPSRRGADQGRLFSTSAAVPPAGRALRRSPRGGAVRSGAWTLVSAPRYRRSLV